MHDPRARGMDPERVQPNVYLEFARITSQEGRFYSVYTPDPKFPVKHSPSRRLFRLFEPVQVSWVQEGEAGGKIQSRQVCPDQDVLASFHFVNARFHTNWQALEYRHVHIDILGSAQVRMCQSQTRSIPVRTAFVAEGRAHLGEHLRKHALKSPGLSEMTSERWQVRAFIFSFSCCFLLLSFTCWSARIRPLAGRQPYENTLQRRLWACKSITSATLCSCDSLAICFLIAPRILRSLFAVCVGVNVREEFLITDTNTWGARANTTQYTHANCYHTPT
jgi:hypothetical protein